MNPTYTTYIHTTPDRLWQALTSPTLTRRYFDFMMGFMAVESDRHAGSKPWQPGSAIRYRTGNGQTQIEGEILSIEPPTLLTLTFSLRYDDDVRREAPSRLSWEILPMGEICKLTVVHECDASARTAQDVAIFMPSILSNLRILLETGKPRLIKEIVVDCAAPATLATFWAAALGYIMQGPAPDPEDDFVAIADPLGVGPELGFQRVPEPKTVKNRVHLDLHVTGRAAEVERLINLGARKAADYPAGWTVLHDPEGNEFCIVDG